MENIKEIVKAFCLANDIVPLCEECFYLIDSECPDFPHICQLEESLKSPGGKEWTLENLADKIEMREQLKKTGELERWLVDKSLYKAGSLVFLYIFHSFFLFEKTSRPCLL